MVRVPNAIDDQQVNKKATDEGTIRPRPREGERFISGQIGRSRYILKRETETFNCHYLSLSL